MLLRQDLSRRHQSDLVSIFDGDNSRLERDNRLAGSDIPLQQPAHRKGLLQISDNFFQYAFLRGGGMKRQDFFDRFACTGADLEGNARTRSLFAPLELKAELDKEEFVKDQPDMRGCARRLKIAKAFARIRPMNFRQRLSRSGQAQMCADRGGYRVRPIRS